MRNFKEFIGVFYDEDEIISNPNDCNAYITIDLNSVCAWNQCDNGNISVDVQGGSRYRLDINYSDFCKLMKDNGNN